MTEEWRAVVGYEGLYEVSDLGRVRSLDRVITRKGKAGCVLNQPYLGVLLKLRENADGYLYVSLCGRKTLVHVIVAKAFLPPPTADQTQVDHRFGVIADNRPSELRWATQSLNNRNRHKSRGPSGVVGVRFRHDRKNPWQAYVNDEGFKSLGHFQTKQQAVDARKAAQENLGV